MPLLFRSAPMGLGRRRLSCFGRGCLGLSCRLFRPQLLAVLASQLATSKPEGCGLMKQSEILRRMV